MSLDVFLSISHLFFKLAEPEEGAATEGADAVALNAYAVALNAE